MDATGLGMEIKMWTTTATDRQPLEALNPTWTSQEYRTYHETLNPNESKSIPCGQKMTLMWSDNPVSYAIDSGMTMLGRIFMLGVEGETHTLTMTAQAGNVTKVRMVCID